MFNDYYAGNYGGVNFDKVDTGAQILVHSGKSDYVQLLHNTGGIWGIRGNVGGNLLFQLGSTNKISGWTFNANSMYMGQEYQSGNYKGITLTNKYAVTGGGGIIAHKDSGSFVAMAYNSDTDWGIRGGVSGVTYFQLGSSNMIAGWNFDSNALYTGVKATVNTPSASGITFFSQGAISAQKFVLKTNGEIAATGGTIGGVTITGNYLGIDASNTGTGNIGSFFAARYLGLRSGPNYFRVDTGSGNALQATIRKTSDITAALSIENTSADSSLKLGIGIQSMGSNYFYGYNAVQFLGGSSMNTDTTNPYLEVSNQGVAVNVPVNAVGPNITRYRGYLVLQTTPGTIGSLTQVYFRRAT